MGGFEWFWMGSFRKKIQFLLKFLKVLLFLGPTLFVLYINYLGDVICDIPICDYDSTLSSESDQTFGL